MFELDHDLAQDIVNRAMAILPCNVNVMDSQGLILGSGEPERINTRHEGAQLVLANGRIVELDVEAAKCLKGVQPGVNLPLMLDGRLIGVLGLTGDPQQLRTYGELVRMTAEMLLAQRHLQVEQQWRRQRCDDLLALLLGGSGDSPRLLDEAQQLGLKPQLPRVPCLFELRGGPPSETLAAWLMNRYPDSWCVSPARDSLLWCRPAGPLLDEDKLVERLLRGGWEVQRMAMGSPAQSLEQLRRGYRRVRDLPPAMANCAGRPCAARWASRWKPAGAGCRTAARRSSKWPRPAASSWCRARSAMPAAAAPGALAS